MVSVALGLLLVLPADAEDKPRTPGGSGEGLPVVPQQGSRGKSIVISGFLIPPSATAHSAFLLKAPFTLCRSTRVHHQRCPPAPQWNMSPGGGLPGCPEHPRIPVPRAVLARGKYPKNVC